MTEKIRIPKAYSKKEIQMEIKNISARAVLDLDSLKSKIEAAMGADELDEFSFEKAFYLLQTIQITLEDLSSFIEGKKALGGNDG